MGAAAFTWRPSPHIWTREAIAVGAIADLVRRALTARASTVEAAALQRLSRTLGEGTPAGDHDGIGDARD